MIVGGVSVGILSAILGLYLISPLFVTVPMPPAILLEKANQETEKNKERHAAYGRDQERIRMLFEEKLEGSEICQVHKENLKPDRVRIAYGLILPRHEYEEAQKRQFPNSNKFAHGGCVVRKPEVAYVLFCTRCREQETRWKAQHQRRTRSVNLSRQIFDSEPNTTLHRNNDKTTDNQR